MKGLFVLCIGFLALIFFDGCKKGPEDPFISLRSRKHRIEGYWGATQYLDNGIDSTIITRKSFETSAECGEITTETMRSINIRFRFDGDGRYEKDSTFTWHYAIDFENEDPLQTHTYSFEVPTTPAVVVSGIITCEDFDSLYVDHKVITKGIWRFGTRGEKNKRYLFLKPDNGSSQEMYDIIECRESEIKLSKVVFNTDGSLHTIQYNMQNRDGDLN